MFEAQTSCSTKIVFDYEITLFFLPLSYSCLMFIWH